MTRPHDAAEALNMAVHAPASPSVSNRDVVPEVAFAVLAAGERSGLPRRQRAPKFGGVTGRTG